MVLETAPSLFTWGGVVRLLLPHFCSFLNATELKPAPLPLSQPSEVVQNKPSMLQLSQSTQTDKHWACCTHGSVYCTIKAAFLIINTQASIQLTNKLPGELLLELVRQFSPQGPVEVE